MASQASRARRAFAAPGDGWSPRVETVLVTLGFAVLTVALVLVSTLGQLYLYGALGAAAYVALLALLGLERTAVLTLMVAFGTAPMYKGLASSPDAQVTPTDLLLALGFGLLMPILISRRAHLPVLYLVGMAIVIATGCIGSLVSDDTSGAFIALILWVMVMGGLPTFFALWRPSGLVMELLLWCYVAGHMVSTADAILGGESMQGRYAGLATHFNYFAQAGMMTLAIVLYLYYRRPQWWIRGAAVLCAALAVYSIHLSGSRAATLVAAVLILMVPLVERSAVTGFVWAALGALVIVVAPLIVDIAGETSALGRLAGGGGSELSNQARELGQETGFDRFWAHPFTGDGLVDLFEIHNNYLEVAVGIGIFGLLGYLLVLYTFARPLFGTGEHRRLCYTAWGYIGFGATIPSLVDRSIWAPVSMAMIAVIGSTFGRDSTDADALPLSGSSGARAPAGPTESSAADGAATGGDR